MIGRSASGNRTDLFTTRAPGPKTPANPPRGEKYGLKLPQKPGIGLTLASTGVKGEVEIDAPTRGSPLIARLKVPKPDWEIIDERFGYLSLRNPAGGISNIIIEAMPKLRATKGLVLDVRGNEGGAGLEHLTILAAYLLPPDQPRKVVGQYIAWADSDLKSGETTPASKRLSAAGQQAIKNFQAQFKPTWRPPGPRATVARSAYVARREAEPDLSPYNIEAFPQDTYFYDKPIVVLYDHHCHSAGELFLGTIRLMPKVTLVGTSTTAAGGGAPKPFLLNNSKLGVAVATRVFLRADGRLIDGIGIEPDVLAEPDADYFNGNCDRMLETATKILSTKIAANKTKPAQ